MRAPLSELPVVLEAVTLAAGPARLLDAVDLQFRKGAPTVIVGPNGAGKSSLLRLLMGLSRPTMGRISWGGREAGPPTRRALLFQRPVMLRRSVAGNVAYALRQAGVPRRDLAPRIDQLLARVGLQDFAVRPARRLSGGEQQRLALARAFARDPELLLLDEPTASLDPAATRAVEQIITDAAEAGIKVVMASHDLGQVRRLAGDVVFLLRGRVNATAPAAAFFDQPPTPEAAAFLRGDIVI
jgi:tungstate transport system ATP-binding protein